MIRAETGRCVETVEFREDGRDRGGDRGLHFFGEGATQFRRFRDNTNKQNFLGAFPAEFGEEQGFDERGIVRADALRNGNANKFVFPVEANITSGSLGADGIEQNNAVVVGEERGNAEARSTQVVKDNIGWKFVESFQNLDDVGADAVITHQHIADTENADAPRVAHEDAASFLARNSPKATSSVAM